MMKIPRTYYSILAVFCIAVICTGIVSAVDQAQVHRNSTLFKGPGHQGFDLTNTTLQQELVARYQQQGVDVTGLQAAFQSGNMTDVKEWMKAHRQSPAGKITAFKGKQGFDLTNTTFQQEMITRLQQQGIDVTGLQTAFQSGNMTGVMEWMKDHRPAPAGNASAFKGKQGFDLTNTTLQQEMIARYQQQGIDLTGLQNAFQSGNMTEVKEWMKEHRPATGTRGHKTATPPTSATGQ